MRSSFRIDKNSIISSSTENIVILPNLEELLDKEEDSDLKESEQPSAEDKMLAAKQKQLRQLVEEQERVRLETEQLIRSAEEQREEIKAQAAQDGYRMAREKAQLEVADERAEEKRAFERIVQEFAQTERQREQLAEQGIGNIAMTVAEKILNVALERDDEAFQGIVRNAANILKQESRKRMRVSEKDFNRFFSSKESELLKEMNSAGVEIISDPTLKMGDCVMESSFGTVNTGVTSQLKHIMSELKEV